ncbi:hypothetical protein LCGC14_1653190 [marine sediment metagenome]|uniref:Uncharacterized protein n=1 Tax=marine sediment metagenome TaxID=412755 RepID=A0A0F9KC44_9ZZZZ
MTYKMKTFVIMYKGKGQYNLYLRCERGKGNSLRKNHNYYKTYPSDWQAELAAKILAEDSKYTIEY